MKKIYLTLLPTLLTLFCFAQQITFQGKLYQNNAPITGSGNFQFLINNGGINWSETQNGVPVNNGLYAVVLGSVTPMPLDLFKTSQSIGMQVLYNGTLIDNVTLHAPFERDYTVPDNIKDGISWGEVSNKPALDTSLTNELQTLAINGNTLSISQGNSVTLPSGSGSGGSSSNVVTGTFTVQDTNVVTLVSTAITNCQTQNISSAWQSFLSTGSGKLRAVQVYLGVNGNNFVTVKVYSGSDNTGQQIGNNVVITGISGGAQNRILDLSAIIPPVSLDYGKQYTVEIIAPLGNTIAIGYNPTSVDVYPNGKSVFGIPNDLCFDVLIDKSNPPSLFVNSNGNVGIGTNSPTAALQVNGRVKDATGFLAPVGSVQAYAGTQIPQGWLLCDGSSLSRTQYADLFNAIGTSWGNPVTNPVNQSFNLPDLRGLFLRGVDGGAGRDPNSGASSNNGTDSKRYPSKPGGATGNNVGSIQNDQFLTHKHPVSDAFPIGHNWNGGNTASILLDYRGANACCQNTNSAGGDETRPKNAYVYYIIKY